MAENDIGKSDSDVIARRAEKATEQGSQGKANGHNGRNARRRTLLEIYSSLDTQEKQVWTLSLIDLGLWLAIGWVVAWFWIL